VASRRFMAALWAFFALFIVYGTTAPFRFTTAPEVVAGHLSHVVLDPLISPDTGRRESIPDLVQNVLLFVPFGVLGILTRGASTRSVILVTGLAAALSTTVETIQLFTLDRVASFGDMVFDTTGALLGTLVAVSGRRTARLTLQRLEDAGALDEATLYPASVAGLVLCAAAWRPFDVTLDVGTVLSKVHAFRYDLWQFPGVLTDEGVTLVRYTWFAFATGAWLHGIRTNRRQSRASPPSLGPAALAAGIGVAAAFGLELSLAFIASGPAPRLEDALVGASGAVLGALLWAGRPRIAPRGWFGVLLAVTAVSAAIQVLSPFEAAPTYQVLAWLPSAWRDTDAVLPAISHAIGTALIYLPLGFWFAGARRHGSGTALAATGLSILISLPLECALGWIQGSDPNAVDIGFSMAGGCLGAWLGLRSIGRGVPVPDLAPVPLQ
jgi:glycopeptide antibiotics resistance protein